MREIALYNVEQYRDRTELSAQSYMRVDDATLTELRQCTAQGHHSNVIKGIRPTPEIMALFGTFLEEHVPVDVCGLYAQHSILEQIVPADRIPALKKIKKQDNI